MTRNRQSDDPMAGLLRHGLRQASVAGKECPSTDILAAHFERSLSPTESVNLESHLATCAHCQEQMAALARMETAVGVPARGATPVPRSWFLNWRWLTPAMLAATGAFALWVMIPSQSRLGETAQVPAVREPASPQTPAAAPPPAPLESKNAASAAAAKSAESDFALQRKMPPVDAPGKAQGLAGGQGSKVDLAVPSAPQRMAQATGGTAGARLADEKKTDAVLQVQDIPARRKDLDLAAEKRSEMAKLAPGQKPEAVIGELVQEREAQRPAVAQAPVATPAPAQAQQPATQQPYAAPKLPTMQSTIVVSNEAKTEVGRDRAPEAPPKQNEEGLLVAKSRAAAPRAGFSTLSGRILWRFYQDQRIERYDERLKSGDFVASPVLQELLAASAPSEKVCWAVGRAGAIIRTVNAEPWKPIGSPTEEDLVFIGARDEQNATVRTRSGKTYVTSDGGRSWRSP